MILIESHCDLVLSPSYDAVGGEWKQNNSLSNQEKHHKDKDRTLDEHYNVIQIMFNKK